jgi:cAMP phosphodiesterase
LQDELDFEEELELFDSATEAYSEAAIEEEEQDYIDYREEQAELIRETYVAYTYIPKYYDTHPHELFHK